MNHNKNYLFALSLIVLVGVIVWGFALKVSYAKINENRKNLSLKKDALLVTKQASVIESKLLTHRITTDNILSILPTNETFLNFTSFLESSANTNNATLKIDFSDGENKSVKSEEVKKTVKDNKVEFTLELTGTKNDLLNTVKEIEAGKYFVDLNKISFIARSDDGSLAVAKIQGVVYVNNGFEK